MMLVSSLILSYEKTVCYFYKLIEDSVHAENILSLKLLNSL